MSSEHSESWGLNSINGGIAHRIRHALDEDTKARFGALSFVVAALEVATDELPHWSVKMRVNRGPLQELSSVVCVVAANARSVGGGFQVAPDADIEDGKLDLAVVSGEGTLEMLNVALRTRLGLVEGSDHLEIVRASHVELMVPPDFSFTVDGEEFKGRDLTIRVVQAALPYVAGPSYGERRAAS